MQLPFGVNVNYVFNQMTLELTHFSLNFYDGENLDDIVGDLQLLRHRLRQSLGGRRPQLVHGELRLDPATHQVTLSGQAVELAPREYALLRLLLENSGKVLSRNQLEQSLYGWSGDVESNAIEVHVHHLRRKLGNQLIRTVRGIGYGIDQPAP